MRIMTPLRWIVIPGIWLATTQAHALGEVSVIYPDAANYGFNDTTAVAAVPGTSATTLGQQRKNAMEEAAKFWGDYLNNKHPITIQAKFLSNGSGITCTAQGGTLAYAGASASSSNITVTLPFGIAGNVTALPEENTSYPVALAEELADNANLNATNKPYEIEATFNASIGEQGCISSGGWYYGYGASATTKPTGHSSFYETARHELAHGLGFSTGVSQSGKKSTVTFNFNGQPYPIALDDPYMANLKDAQSGKLWPNMDDTERAASALSNPNLVWNGVKVTEKAAPFTDGKTNNQVRMHAPAAYRQGSSVSHFDTSVTPDELMEADDSATTVDTLTKALMCDIGWKGDDCSTTATTTNGIVNITGTAQVDQTLTAVVSDSDGFGAVTYQWLAGGTAISGATNATYVVQHSDVGKKITVKATYSDNSGNAESPTSSETAAVTAAANRVGSVTISGGTPQVGKTLTAAVSDADGTVGVTVTYQWLANGANISNTTSPTYTLTANELGKTITVKATYTDQRSNLENLTSAATAAVTAATTVAGDSDGNGVLEVADIFATIRQVFNGQAKTPGADYDNDGSVTTSDIFAVIRKLFS